MTDYAAHEHHDFVAARPVFPDERLGHSELIDALFDRQNRLRHRLAPVLGLDVRLHLKRIGTVDPRRPIVSLPHALIGELTELCVARRRNALDDERGKACDSNRRPGDAAILQRLLKLIDR